MPTLTIKTVLDSFIAVGCARCSIQLDGLPKQPENGGPWRTTDNLLHCPLAVATGELRFYYKAAIKAGLAVEDINCLIRWADTGRWSMV